MESVETECPYCFNRSFTRATKEEVEAIPKYRRIEAGDDPIVKCENCDGYYAASRHKNFPVMEGKIPLPTLVGARLSD